MRAPPQPDAGNTTDAALLAAVREHGDEAAFRQLYRRYTPALYQLALRLTGGNAQQAEEIVQDTWVSAVAVLARFRGESSLRTWLGAIVVNRFRDWRRRMRRWRQRMLPLSHDLARRSLALDDRLDLEAVLAAMPEGYRTVLVMHDLEGYTHEEIGRLLHVTSGTSKAQLFHARRMIREHLGGR